MAETHIGDLCNIEAEQAVLGAALVNNSALELIPSSFEDHHFGDDIHRKIFKAMMELWKAGKPFNPITIKAKLNDVDMVRGLTIAKYLALLASEAVNFAGLPSFCQAITEMSVRRDLWLSSSALRQVSSDRENSLIDEIEALKSRIDELQTRLTGADEVGVSIGMAATHAIASSSKAMTGAVDAGTDCGLDPVRQLIGKLMGGHLIIIGGGTKQGKGQPLDAKILTPFGYRRMGDMSVGSQVTAPDGTVAKILQIHKLGIRQLFDVQFSDGTKCEVTDDHLWLARRTRKVAKRAGKIVSNDQSFRKYTTTEMMDLMASNKSSRFHIPVTAPVPFTSGRGKDRPIHPYVLGVLLGDGCLTKGTPEFCSADAEIVSRVEEKLGRKVTKSAGDKTAPTYRLTGMPEIKAYLIRSKLYGKVSHNKYIPKQYLYSSIEDRLEMARGLLDTDGWAGSSEADAAAFFGTSSKRLAEDAAWLFRSLGSVVNISENEKFYTHNGEKKQGLNSFTLRIRHPNTKELFSLTRKQEKCGAPRYMTRSIVSITPGRKAEAQCITVSHPSSLYLTNDFIVTHNSSLARQIGLGAAKNGAAVLDYSGEMDSEELAMRELARLTRVTATQQMMGDMTPKEADMVREARQKIDKLPWHIIDKRRTIEQLCREFEAFARKNGRSILIVDSVTLFEPDQFTRKLSKFEFAEYATDRFKALARKTGCAVIALSQLKKNTFAVERQYGKKVDIKTFRNVVARRPRASDLYGACERDADHVLIPFNPWPILQEIEPADGSDEHIFWEEVVEEYQGRAEIILAISRHRTPDRRRVRWDGSITSFLPEQNNSQGRMQF